MKDLTERLRTAHEAWRAAYLNVHAPLFAEAAEALSSQAARIAELEARIEALAQIATETVLRQS